jgi:hypothetical protein
MQEASPSEWFQASAGYARAQADLVRRFPIFAGQPLFISNSLHVHLSASALQALADYYDFSRQVIEDIVTKQEIPLVDICKCIPWIRLQNNPRSIEAEVEVKEIVRGYKDLLFTQYSAFLVVSLTHPTLSSLIFDSNDPSHGNIRNSIFALSTISHTQPRTSSWNSSRALWSLTEIEPIAVRLSGCVVTTSRCRYKKEMNVITVLNREKPIMAGKDR